MIYRYNDIVIRVISRERGVASAIPVSETAKQMFTLDDGVLKIPIETLKIFDNDIR